MNDLNIDIPDIFLLSPNRVWRTYLGGRQLDQLESNQQPKDAHFPEDWIASTTKAVNIGREDLDIEGMSYVNILGQDYKLRDLFKKYPEEFLGPAHFKKYGANSQFLLKILDSSIRLHIQAHPTIPFAKKYLNSSSGKTEAYYILNIRNDVSEPYIYLGFQHPPKLKDFKRMIIDQDIEAILSCFEKIRINPGDAFIVPGGLPHAIGEGVLMVEIMEPTDLVVRLEFERGGYVLPEISRFMGRDIDFALSMLDFNQISKETIHEKYFLYPQEIQCQGKSIESSIIDESVTPCFKVKKIEVNSQFRIRENSFYVGIVTQGRGRVRIDKLILPVRFGDKFFVPFKTEEIYLESDENMEVISVSPPSSK